MEGKLLRVNLTKAGCPGFDISKRLRKGMHTVDKTNGLTLFPQWDPLNNVPFLNWHAIIR